MYFHDYLHHVGKVCWKLNKRDVIKEKNVLLPPEVFYKKGVKMQASISPFLPKRLWHRCSPVDFMKF